MPRPRGCRSVRRLPVLRRRRGGPTPSATCRRCRRRRARAHVARRARCAAPCSRPSSSRSARNGRRRDRRARRSRRPRSARRRTTPDRGACRTDRGPAGRGRPCASPRRAAQERCRSTPSSSRRRPRCRAATAPPGPPRSRCSGSRRRRVRSRSSQVTVCRMARWTNWAGNQSCTPDQIAHPSTEGELAHLVERARGVGAKVRVAGSGHSFTPVVCTDDTIVDLSRYRSVLEIDSAAATATVQAGITLREMNAVLAANGLAFENLGDIAYQTIAGATQTATHGTGAQFGNLSSRIVGMRLLTGDGAVVECSASVEPDVFDRGACRCRGARLGIDHHRAVRARVQPARRRGRRARRRPAREHRRRGRRQRPLRVLLDPEHALGAHQAQPTYARAGATPSALARVPRRGALRQPRVRCAVPHRSGASRSRSPRWRSDCRARGAPSTPMRATGCSPARGVCTSWRWSTPSHVPRCARP